MIPLIPFLFLPMPLSIIFALVVSALIGIASALVGYAIGMLFKSPPAL